MKRVLRFAVPVMLACAVSGSPAMAIVVTLPSHLTNTVFVDCETGERIGGILGSPRTGSSAGTARVVDPIPAANGSVCVERRGSIQPITIGVEAPPSPVTGAPAAPVPDTPAAPGGSDDAGPVFQPAPAPPTPGPTPVETPVPTPEPKPLPRELIPSGYTGLGTESTSAHLGAIPLTELLSLEYLGGFRLRLAYKGSQGPGRVQRSSGPITIDDGVLYIASHPDNHAVGKFPIPLQGDWRKELREMPVVAPASDWEPVNDYPFRVHITGLAVIDDKVVVNTTQYYDGSNSFPDDQTILGAEPYPIAGRAEAAGWFARIPLELQGILGGDWLMGSASNLPINTRQSQGPSLVAINSSAVGADPVTKTWLRYSLLQPLGTYGRQPDIKGLNPGAAALKDAEVGFPGRASFLWNEMSVARYGFIHGTDGDYKYIVLGRQGGADHGIGYKAEDERGKTVGGYMSFISTDRSPWYWIYDVDDILAGPSPEQVVPESYGPLDIPYGIAGAWWDGTRLYIHSQLNDESQRIQSRYEPEPVILVYELK